MSKKVIYFTVALLFLAVCVPPVDRVEPATGQRPLYPMVPDSPTVGPQPEIRHNLGFKFVGDMEQNEQIRMNQLILELGVILAAGLLLSYASKPKSG